MVKHAWERTSYESVNPYCECQACIIIIQVFVVLPRVVQRKVLNNICFQSTTSAPSHHLLQPSSNNTHPSWTCPGHGNPSGSPSTEGAPSPARPAAGSLNEGVNSPVFALTTRLSGVGQESGASDNQTANSTHPPLLPKTETGQTEEKVDRQHS